MAVSRISTAGIPGIATANASPWVRPSDWLTLPTVNDGDEKVVGLVAVWPGGNPIGISCAGAFTVDWGDGTVTNYATGVTASHSYTWAGVSSATVTSEGHRQAIVTVTPQAGQSLTSVNFAVVPTGASSGFSPQWRDITMAGHNVASLTVAATTARNAVRQFTYVGASAITSANSMFASAARLAKVNGTTWTSGVTAFDSMFQSCSSLTTIPLINTAAGTSFFSMFNSCSSLTTIPLINTAAGTSFTSMFNGCSSLTTIPLINTAAGTSFATMFNGCQSLSSVPLLNVVAGTSFSNMFAGCLSLSTGAISGGRFAISYASCLLSASAMNDIYTALGTASGAQTITMTGNPGSGSSTTSIATGKGWTVTGG